MVELVEVVLNLGGWVVAAVVTLVGIFLLHLWEQSSRERRQVLSPLHDEVTRFSEEILVPVMLEVSGSPPRFESEFQAVWRSGLLHLRRHDALRRDVGTFRRLRDEAEETAWRLSSASNDAVKGIYAKAGLEVWDNELVTHLTQGNMEGWMDRFTKRLPEDQQGPLGDLGETPEELYRAVLGKVDEARVAHHEKAKELMEHAGRVQVGLQRAMRSFRGRYRSSPRKRG